MNSFFRASVHGLSPSPRRALASREDEVMRLLAKGRLYKEIADELEVSQSTVHKHKHNIFLKLHVGNRTEAAGKWMETKTHAPVAAGL